MANLLKRGNTWYARYSVPEDRWADVGKAIGAKSGICREKVRTLQTTDHREAVRRRDRVIADLQAEIDRALRRANLKPLTDWTDNWMDRATLQRLNMEAGKDVIAFYEPSDNGIPSRWTQADITSGQVELEAMELEAHKGPEVAQRFLDVALGDGLLIAEAARRWLATMAGKRQNQSLKGHSAALALLGRYLETEAGLGTLDGLALGQITRRLAGEFIAWRLSQTSMTTGRPISAATVQREFSAYSGLWKWAVTRGYVEANPWADQLTGIKTPAKHGDTGNNPEDKRAYSTAEIIAFLEATETTLALGWGRLRCDLL